MADVVRLAIVYETQQAASNLNVLNTRLGVSTVSFRKAGLAAVLLTNAMETGSISAVSMASSLGRIAAFLLGPWGIAIAVAIGLLTAFKNHQDKTRETAAKFHKQLHDVKQSVDDLFRPIAKTPFQSEVESITDAILDLDAAINQAHASWLTKIADFFRGSGLQIGGPGGISWISGKHKRTPEEIQRDRLRAERALLTPEAERQHISDVASAEQRNARNVARLLGTSQINMMSDSLDRARKELEDLIKSGLDPMSDQAKQMATGIKQGEEALRRMTRAAAVLRGGLQTIADSIEEFVVTGTLAFTDFLNNILRLLYKDFTGSIIDSIVRSAGGSTSNTSGGSAGFAPPPGPINQSLQTNVSFNVNAIDAQGVAQFFDQNGAQIAATVARHADRSRAIRRRFLRG